MKKKRRKKMDNNDINDLLTDIEKDFIITEETIINNCNDDDCDCEVDNSGCGGCGGGCN
jgi:hypothetical protein